MVAKAKKVSIDFVSKGQPVKCARFHDYGFDGAYWNCFISYNLS